MKKILKSLMFVIGMFFMIIGVVKANTFYEGSYISGEYINKEINGKTYYMTMQYIKDDKGNIVYCLEPFVSFENGKSYKLYEDIYEYKNLSDNQKRRISLIIYYGYGYRERTDSKWYVITQYLVWKEIGGNIYFTKTLNGTKIDKYIVEQQKILNDVNNHDIVPNFVKDYILDYNKNLVIDGLNKNYEIVSSDFDYSYDSNNNLVIKNALDNGKLIFKKISNYYDNKVTIYDSSNSQDVIKPGNVVNKELMIDVFVNKGDITLDIRNDDSVYTIESDFSNTCYTINKDNEVIDSVCTGNEPLVYKTESLEYGEYQIKQISVGIGYVPDINVYNVLIDDSNKNVNIILYNKLIKNDIQLVKYSCKYDDCVYEANALFVLYDRDNNIAGYIKTNESGYGYITLGYGKYVVEQVEGLDCYTFSDSYEERIDDGDTEHYNILYDHFIEEEIVSDDSEEFFAPDTKIDNSFILIIRRIFEQYLIFLKNLL
ncbi:MAG: Cys-Gln thioester bond-forming surface protein [Candidatus Coprovivens sp.]